MAQILGFVSEKLCITWLICSGYVVQVVVGFAIVTTTLFLSSSIRLYRCCCCCCHWQPGQEIAVVNGKSTDEN